MARVSKKVSAAQREAENAPHRIWKTAIYARLSDFDDVLRIRNHWKCRFPISRSTSITGMI